MPKLSVMDHTGHSEHVFDRAKVLEVEEAERRFKKLTGAGFTAATRLPSGEAQVVRAFDPAVEETLFIPRLKGG